MQCLVQKNMFLIWLVITILRQYVTVLRLYVNAKIAFTIISSQYIILVSTFLNLSYLVHCTLSVMCCFQTNKFLFLCDSIRCSRDSLVQLSCVGFSLWCLLLLQNVGSRVHGLP